MKKSVLFSIIFVCIFGSCEYFAEESVVFKLNMKYKMPSGFSDEMLQDKCYIFRSENEMQKIMHTDSAFSQKFDFINNDIVISIGYMINAILINTPMTKRDLCADENDYNPVEVVLDSAFSDSLIYIYTITPKGKYRKICP